MFLLYLNPYYVYSSNHLHFLLDIVSKKGLKN
uniref:Uncharacterized protein n=1 Tax=Lepeophtheirus salmonis TaxID=72036 RepID=A0A0K2UV90_LEPSM